MKRANKKFRCSSFGHILSGAVLPSAPKLTDAQNRDLNELLSKIKLTEKQAEKRDELIVKRDTIIKPALSKGAKTHIEKEFYKDHFGYTTQFSNKYTEKGKSDAEERSIREVGQFLGYPFATKAPEKYLENDFICTSGYDWKVNKFVFDQKNVWAPEGLKLFDEEKDLNVYEWQIRGYAMLINELEGGSIDKGAIVRTLMNPSEHLILKEARLLWVEAGYSYKDEMTESFVDEVREMYNFEGKFPNIKNRMRIHAVECTSEHFELIRIYVKLAQEYYNSLFEIAENCNENQIEIFKNQK